MITFLNLGRLGRLGNQLFEIASTIGIAIKSGQDYAFPYWMNYDAKERFGSLEDIDVQKYFKNPLPVLEDAGRYQFTEVPYYWGYRDEYYPHGNFNLNAHMQSEKFFLHCADRIRHYFEMKDECDQRETVAIHWRSGDYDDNYHPKMKKEYFVEAMSYFPNHQYDVFTDDPKAFTDMMKGVDFPIVSISHNGTYISDFQYMKGAKSFIICNSTYSWWAAWLGSHPDKKVICPRKWHGDHTGLDPTDLYCQNWIVI